MSQLQKLIEKIELNADYAPWIPQRSKLVGALRGLKDMIGNEQTKEDIAKQIMTLVRSKDRPNGKEFMLNTALYGPPGVGKTQIAQKLGLIFTSLGFLEKGPAPNLAKGRGKGKGVEFSAERALLLGGFLGILWNVLVLAYRKGGLSLLVGLILILAILLYYLFTKYILNGEEDNGRPVIIETGKDVKVSKEAEENIIQVVSREDFVDQWMGWTTKKTTELLQRSHGKVLFVDEAYSLVMGERDQYGNEALNVINRYISEHPRNIIIIFAGYRDKMESLFSSQPGLRRRFMWNFDCPGYTIEELFQIFLVQVTAYNLTVDKKSLRGIRKLFKDIKQFPSQAGDTERLVNYCDVEHNGLDKSGNSLDLEDVSLGMKKLADNNRFNEEGPKKNILEQLSAAMQ